MNLQFVRIVQDVIGAASMLSELVVHVGDRFVVRLELRQHGGRQLSVLSSEISSTYWTVRTYRGARRNGCTGR